jgi:DNA mismatch endonuclease (patch repair protein)
MVHGCFWHRHPGCQFAYEPKSRVAFWREKFAKNVERDRRTNDALRKLGWRIFTVWECELRNPERVMASIKTSLSSRA